MLTRKAVIGELQNIFKLINACYNKKALMEILAASKNYNQMLKALADKESLSLPEKFDFETAVKSYLGKYNLSEDKKDEYLADTFYTLFMPSVVQKSQQAVSKEHLDNIEKWIKEENKDIITKDDFKKKFPSLIKRDIFLDLFEKDYITKKIFNHFVKDQEEQISSQKPFFKDIREKSEDNNVSKGLLESAIKRTVSNLFKREKVSDPLQREIDSLPDDVKKRPPSDSDSENKDEYGLTPVDYENIGSFEDLGEDTRYKKLVKDFLSFAKKKAKDQQFKMIKTLVTVSGTTLNDIAKQFDVSYDSVRMFLTRTIIPFLKDFALEQDNMNLYVAVERNLRKKDIDVKEVSKKFREEFEFKKKDPNKNKKDSPVQEVSVEDYKLDLSKKEQHFKEETVRAQKTMEQEIEKWKSQAIKEMKQIQTEEEKVQSLTPEEKARKTKELQRERKQLLRDNLDIFKGPNAPWLSLHKQIEEGIENDLEKLGAPLADAKATLEIKSDGTTRVNVKINGQDFDYHQLVYKNPEIVKNYPIKSFVDPKSPDFSRPLVESLHKLDAIPELQEIWNKRDKKYFGQLKNFVETKKIKTSSIMNYIGMLCDKLSAKITESKPVCRTKADVKLAGIFDYLESIFMKQLNQ